MTEFVTKQLEMPETLGKFLKDAREKKQVTLEAAEEETKVRIKYLEALEEGKYEILPADVYALGFLTKYADYLEVDKQLAVKKFKQERGDSSKNIKILAPERKIKEPLFTITPKTTLIGGILLAILLVISYFIYSINQFTSPPNLAIISPSAEQVITQDKVEIKGRTDEGVTLTINGQAVEITASGDFSEEVTLNTGLNTFEIKAVNQLKKETVKTLKVLAELAKDESLVEDANNLDNDAETTSDSQSKLQNINEGLIKEGQEGN